MSVLANRKHRLEAAGLFLALNVAVIGIWEVGIGRGFEDGFRDLVIALGTTERCEVHDAVIIVEVDEKTVQSWDSWVPLDRTRLAELVESIKAARPKLVGIDLLLIDTKNRVVDEKLSEALSSDEEGDQEPIPVVVATRIHNGQYQGVPSTFDRPGVHSGVANLLLSRSDRILRYYRTAFSDSQGRLHPTFPAEIARLAGISIRESDANLPIDWYSRPQGRARADSPGCAGPFATFRAQTVMDLPLGNQWLHERLGDRIVLIGATFEASRDPFQTPFNRLPGIHAGIAGVNAQAQILAQLIDGREVRVLSSSWTWIIAVIAILIGVFIALQPRSMLVSIGLTITAMLLWLSAATMVWLEYRLFLPALHPTLIGLLASVLLFAMLRATRMEFDQRQAVRALARYVPKSVAEQLLNEPDLIQAPGQLREVTVLFTDIGGFTVYAQRTPVSAVFQLLNDYFEQMTDVIFRHDGTLDKYIGDSIMAVFGAPLEDASHSTKAVACALELEKVSHDFEQIYGLPTRIGVHSGPALLGNVGGRRRFDYTVIGDPVNIAARLEYTNKAFAEPGQSSVCISGSTIESVRVHEGPGRDGGGAGAALLSRVRRLGLAQIRGMRESLEVYTSAPETWSQSEFESYEKALQLMANGEFLAAQESLESLPRDHVVRFQIRQCEKRTNVLLSPGADE